MSVRWILRLALFCLATPLSAAENASANPARVVPVPAGVSEAFRASLEANRFLDKHLVPR